MSYQEIEEIRTSTKRGDGVAIAEILGCSKRMAQSVLNGDRGITQPLGKRIINEAKLLIINRSSNKH